MSDRAIHESTTFSRALGDRLTDRGWSLSELHRRLAAGAHPLSIATLSSWRSGARRPWGEASLAALGEIEQILGVNPGALLGLLAEQSPLGELDAAEVLFTETNLDALVAETLQLLDAPSFDVTRELSTQATTEVGADGWALRYTSRTLIQAVAPLVTEVTYTTVSPDGWTEGPRVTPVGARAVRQRLHPSGKVHGVVYELDRPLPHGSTTMLEFESDLTSDAGSDRESGAFVARPIRDLVVWTRFHPDAIPDWIDEVEETAETGGMLERALAPQASVHQARRNFGPGVLGLRWGYGDRED